MSRWTRENDAGTGASGIVVTGADRADCWRIVDCSGLPKPCYHWYFVHLVLFDHRFIPLNGSLCFIALNIVDISWSLGIYFVFLLLNSLFSLAEPLHLICYRVGG